MPKRQRDAPKNRNPKRRRTGSAFRVRKRGKIATTKRSRVRRSRKNARKFVKDVVQKVLHCSTPTGTYLKSAPICQHLRLNVARQYYLSDKWAQGTVRNQNYQFMLGVSPVEIMDAISVVYNGKGKVQNSQIQTGNFNIPKTQIDNLYAAKRYEWVNLTDAVLEVAVWKVVPTKSSSNSFLDDWQLFKDTTNWVGGVPTITVIAGEGYAQVTDGFYPSVTAPMKERYKISKVHHTVAPGGKFYINDYVKMNCFEFRHYKTSDAVNDTMHTFCKGFAQYLLEVKGITRSAYDSTVGAPNYTIGSTKVITDSTLKCMGGWLTETYKFDQPPNTPDIYEGDSRAFLNVTDGIVGADTYAEVFQQSKNTFSSINAVA